MSYRILLATHCAKYCRKYSTGGRKMRNIPKAIPINQKILLILDESLKSTALIILSMTNFKIKGISKGIANFTIPIKTVHKIFHLYGLTNFKYCLIGLILFNLPLLK